MLKSIFFKDYVNDENSENVADKVEDFVEDYIECLEEEDDDEEDCLHFQEFDIDEEDLGDDADEDEI